MYYNKRRRREIHRLNLTALIDICALILIFLVMASYFGESGITVPAGIRIPKSVSKESVENAPQVLISATSVTAEFLKDTAPLDWFHKSAPELEGYKLKLKAFVDRLPPETRTSGVLLNIVADRDTPYRDVFDVISVYREAGFQSILFLAQVK